jgi:hypothetical protein
MNAAKLVLGEMQAERGPLVLRPDDLFAFQPHASQAAEKVLRARREKFATQLDALYAIAEPWAYILLLPIFAFWGIRRLFPQPGQLGVRTEPAQTPS